MSSGGVEKRITLKSSDGETFEVEETVALESQTIKQMVEDNQRTADTVIELPEVTSVTLLKIMEYCKKHVVARSEFESEDEIKNWDLHFIEVDQNTLFDLMMAAYYLNIKSLLNLTCQTVANMIKGRTPEEIRKTFNIEANFTPEEEEEIRRENQWHFV